MGCKKRGRQVSREVEKMPDDLRTGIVERKRERVDEAVVAFATGMASEPPSRLKM
jgi:hypothetical protein